VKSDRPIEQLSEDLWGESGFGPSRGLSYVRLIPSWAIKEFGRAIELNPEDATAYYNRGLTHARSRNYARAIEDLGRAIELNPRDAAAYYNRGLAYARSQDYARAIEDYDRAVELNPKSPAAYNNRGLAHARCQDYTRAIEDFRRAIEVKPKFSLSYYNAARVTMLMGEARGACEWLEKAIELGERYRRMAWRDKVFERMREDERFKTLVGMNEYYEIIPGEAIGPFKLGMTRDEIEGLNIRPMKDFEDNTGVDFPRLGVSLFYDASDKCREIQAALFSKSPTFVLAGHIVNGVSADEAQGIFMSISPYIKLLYAGFELPSVGLRAVKWEAGDDHICAIQVMAEKRRPRHLPAD
jgi:tetratricopeptide (TPR) repeat protein